MTVLEREAIEALIPHRPPFLFVDRILDYEEGVQLRAEMTFTGTEEFFRGHFPQEAVVPGVLLIETAAQASCVLTMLTPANRDRLFLFGSVDRFRFLRPVLPGQRLLVEIEVLKAEEDSGIAACALSVDGQRVAKGRISYAARRRDATA